MTDYQAVWNTVQSKIRNDGGTLVTLKWIDRRGVECEMTTDPHTASMMRIEIEHNGGHLHDDAPCHDCGSSAVIVNQGRCYSCHDQLDAFNEGYEASR